MLAAVYDRFGPPDVLEVREVPEPRAGAGEILVDVRAAALNPKDVLIRTGKLRWVGARRLPGRTGFDLAGDVVAVGAGVRRMQPGDAVFGMLDGYGGGAVAERVVVREREIALLPEEVPYEDGAATALVGTTALQALRDLGRVGRGARVCIHGASGGLGSMAIQIARALGAQVTSVSSARNLGFCRGLGAVETLDYTTGEALRRRWDVFMDCFGDHPYERVRPSLAPGGRHLSVIIRLRAAAREVAARLGLGGAARLVAVRPRPRDLDQLGEWLREGTIRAVIEQTFPMARIADGHRAIETKRTRGKIVITMGGAAGM